MYMVNSNLAKSNSLLTRTKLVSLDRNLPQSGKSGGCGYRRRSSRIWHPAVLVKTRVWVGCTVSRAQKNSTRRSWCSLFEEWCVIFHNHSAWRVIFLLDFRDWWISFETRSTDIKTNSHQIIFWSFSRSSRIQVNMVKTWTTPHSREPFCTIEGQFHYLLTRETLKTIY